MKEDQRVKQLEQTIRFWVSTRTVFKVNALKDK